MQTNRFQSSDSLTSPARNSFDIAPDDATELPELPKAIYVGTGGDISMRLIDSAADVTFRNVPSGYILDVRAQFVRSTGTTAVDLLGLS